MTLNTSAFSTTKTRPKTTLNLSAFGIKAENSIGDIINSKQATSGKLPDFLGGGSYNLAKAGELATSTRAYAGIEAPGQYREHIFPVALGGTSDFDNIKVYGKDLGAKKSAYENVIIKRYQDKKISLPEARGLVLKKFRELTGLDPKQGVFSNLWGGIKQLGSDIKNIPSKMTESAKKQSKSFTTPLGLKVGITEETLQEYSPKDRLATAGVLAGMAYPSKGIGMISEGLPGVRGLSSLIVGGVKKILGKTPKVLTAAAESIAPIKNQNPVVQSTFKTWARELLIGEEKANKQLTKIPQLADDFDTILKYEKGTPTKWTTTIKKEFDALFKKAEENGVKVGYKENYVPQVYNNTLEEIKTAMSKYMKNQGVDGLDIDRYLEGIKELPDIISKRLKLNPFFSKERAFPDYETAIKYGLKPKYTEPSQLLAHYEAELSKTVANRKFLDDLVSKGQVKTVEQAGQDWQALTLPFSPKGYYAPPKLAKMLNGMFRNEEMLGFGATAFKGVAGLSRTMQEIVLSAGVPKTNINFFAIGQLIKNLTAGEFKAAGAFIRSNFNAPSIKFFMDNGKTLEDMADQGIDILKRVDGHTEIYKKLNNTKGIIKKVGLVWDKAFGEKTFKSFMPQMQVQTFKSVYNKAIKKLPEEQAKKLAGDTVKAFYGLHENLGRGKGTEDVLGATFFAPKFREGIINTLFNTGKSITTEIFNPAFAKNRKLIAGMILSYAGYNALNKKLTGHYMWENPSGKEFDLMIPTELGNTEDDVIYIGFMPSFLAFARNIASGGIALVKGDIPTAKQKLGSVFSMPIKVASEIWANKDYFGREIYKNYDDAKTKLKKISSYAFLSVNHPFVKETYKQLTTDKPLYQSISEAMEMPLKFSSYTKIEQQEFYEAIRKQDAKKAKIKEDFRPRYTEVRDLLEAGKIDEATGLTNSMTDAEYKIYESLKRADKTRANVNAEIKIFSDYKEIQELIANGQIDEATVITNKMTDDEYNAYKRLKSKLQ